MLDSLICHYNESLLGTMKIINDNGFGIVFIINDNNELLGVISDGDIRRELLLNKNLDEKIKNIISDDFVFGYLTDSYDVLMKKISEKVKIIPIIDENNKLIDFFEYKHHSYFPVAVPNLNGNEFKYLTDAFLSTWISSNGDYIKKFEDNFSNYSGCANGVSVSNGTVALHLALVTLGIGAGDEVIVPDFTFAATINAVLHANATPVIVDIEENSWCIDPLEIEKAITAKTKAIIPVHIYGQPCDMLKIINIAKKYDLKIIEDCAEAHGAEYAGQKVGSFGDIGCFSFYGNKVITTGEGGMCTTNNPKLAEKMRVLRDHGMSKEKRYWHDVIGYNYRMTNLQAAIGLAQLERINEIHKNRREYEVSYKKVLDNEKIIFQSDLEERNRITWLVSVLVDNESNKQKYMQYLKEKGIDVRSFFYPLSQMDIYKKYLRGSSKNSYNISSRGFNLPTYESLKSVEQVKELVSGVNNV